MKSETAIMQKLEGIQAMLVNSTKPWLTLDELAQYLGLTKRKVYQLTQAKTFTLYKPGGKITYVNRVEVDEWIASHRVSASADAIEVKANDYLLKKIS